MSTTAATALSLLDPVYLRSIFRYDPETGALARLQGGRNKPLTSKNIRGYLMARVDGKSYLAHRVVWLIAHGSHPAGVVDHINGDKTDNRLANLRDVPRQANTQNQRLPHGRGSTGLLGAHRSRNRFRAQIRANGKDIFLGMFDTAQEAHAAYVAAKRQHHEGCTI